MTPRGSQLENPSGGSAQEAPTQVAEDGGSAVAPGESDLDVLGTASPVTFQVAPPAAPASAPDDSATPDGAATQPDVNMNLGELSQRFCCYFAEIIFCQRRAREIAKAM